MTTFLRPSLILVLALGVAGHASAGDGAIDSVMYQNPTLPQARVVKTFAPGLLKLWLQALDRPEADLKCQAALTIALAHRRGMPGLDAAIASLVRELNRQDQHPSVRLAAARALLELNARSAAPDLWRQAEAGDPDLRELVETALAHWDYAPARAAWLDRLGQPPPYNRGTLLAVRGLATLKESRAVGGLRTLLFARAATPPLRLEAARALGKIRQTGSESDAARLAAETSPQDIVARLAAAALLRFHNGNEAVRLLQGLARGPEPTVVAAALTRLVEIDPRLVLPMLGSVLASPDAKVRSFGVEVLDRLPSVDHVRLLGERLADPHPEVRAKARLALRELSARPELHGPIIEVGEKTLATWDWRGQEQAAILLAQLGHRPAAKRLVELLTADRPEVFVAAAWALRQLAVPATLPAVLAHLQHRTRELLADPHRAVPPGVNQQLTQLAQFLGQANYQPADAALRIMVPRLAAAGRFPTFSPIGPEARAAAVWALGLLHAGKPEPAVVQIIELRLTEHEHVSIGKDDDRVRRMAAVSLARMTAQSSLPTLRRYAGDGRPTLSVVSHACAWAVGQLTGSAVPPPGTVEVPQRDWFLTPRK